MPAPRGFTGSIEMHRRAWRSAPGGWPGVAGLPKRGFAPTLGGPGVARLLSVLLLALACFSGAGCRSTKPAGNSPFASTILSWHTPGQIAEMTERVFSEEGYRFVGQERGKLIFERKAGGFSNLAYGNWMDSTVCVRVRVGIASLDEGSFRLECAPVMVRDSGTSSEEELEHVRFRRSPMQKLLDEVARRLSGGKPPA